MPRLSNKMEYLDTLYHFVEIASCSIHLSSKFVEFYIYIYMSKDIVTIALTYLRYCLIQYLATIVDVIAR